MESDGGEPLNAIEKEPVSKQDTRHTRDEYVALGAYIDCENILDKYLKMSSSTFEDFVKLWKELKFSEIYCGRETFGELLEFTEELMIISKVFILPPHSQIKRIGALYLMYGLYTQQPTQGIVKFRVTPQEWSIILKFIENLKVHGFIDANYIFHKMCMDGAFLTVSHLREYGLERNIRKYLMPWPARDREMQACPVFSLESLLSRACRNSLKDHANACRSKYSNIKKSLIDSTFQPLQGTSQELDSILQANIDKSLATATKSLLSDIGLKRGNIKGKAFENKRPTKNSDKATTVVNQAIPSTSTNTTSNLDSDEFESLGSDSGDEYLLQRLKKPKLQRKQVTSKSANNNRNLGRLVREELRETPL